MRTLPAFLLLALVAFSLSLVSGAHAANETATISMAAKPLAGPLYKEVARPLDASITVSVSNPASEPKVTPLKVSTIAFPRDLAFVPNEKRTPACGEDKLSDASNLAAGVAATIALCPRSVIGTGTSVIHVGQTKAFTITDPEMVLFNGGRDKSGRPKVAIYGYSRTVNAGMLMRGVLARNGELRMSVGVMPFDSSVSRFTIGIPGEPLEVIGETGEAMTVQGRDPAYLRGKCSTGSWRARGSFVLGTRDHPSGKPTSDETFVVSDPFTLPCHGRAGKAKLRITKVRGPGKIRPGKKARFVLTVTNRGTATARKLRMKVGGAAHGSRRAGLLRPGKTRRVAVIVRARRRKSSRRLVFRLTARGSIHNKRVRKVRVG